MLHIKNKKAVVIPLICVFLALSLLLPSVFFHFVPEAKYRIKHKFMTTFSFCSLKACSPNDLTEYGIDELLRLTNVTLNESMMLINSEHKITSTQSFDICEYKDSGVYMNSCLCDAYGALSLDIKQKYQNKLYIKSAYRTWQEQESEIQSSGALAADIGSSEHQAGLALDVYVPYFAGNAFIKSDEGQYVSLSSWKHGFIIRYPYYAYEKTGIAYEPWHIRYVGAPHAELITKNALCLEEYINSLEVGKYYKYENYIISRQSADNKLTLPKNFESAVISSDNCGNYIITVKKG